MSRRHFIETPVREDGQSVMRYRLVCGSCGCGESLGRQNFGPERAATALPKKFEERGWHVGKRHDGRDDRCPSCVNREQEVRRRRPTPIPSEETTPVPQTPTTVAPTSSQKLEPTMADKPREASRDERRLILAKLNDVYIDESAGYSAGWTDARVAQDLGVPRAWVSPIREENFGPGTSDEVEKTLTEARAVAAEAATFRQAMDELTARGAEILKRAEAVERAARRIETVAR